MTCSIALGHVGCKKKELFKLHWKDGGITLLGSIVFLI